MSRECIATALRMLIKSALPDRRQRDPETGGTARCVQHRDVAAMQEHDLAHHVEAKAGATIERCESIERFEDLFALIGRNAGAFVGDFDGRWLADANADGAAARAVLDRVLHEVGQRALQRCGIAERLDRRRRRIEGQFIAGGYCQRREVGRDALCDGDQVDRRERMPAAIEPLNIEQLLGERCEPRGILDQAGLVRS